MMDNDSDNDNEHDPDNDNDNEGELNLAGFLFGNVDEHGRLENDFLDEEAKQHLSSLSRMGLSSFLADVLTDGTEKPRIEHSDSDDSSSSDDHRYDDHDDDNANYKIKAEDAVDFSDFNELAEDLPVAIEPSDGKKGSGGEDDYDDIEAAIPVSKVDVKGGTSDGGADDEKSDGVDDKRLMPPPSAPISGTDGKSDSEDALEKPKLERKLDTPLAAMLPSKYVNVDVRELFPDFRPDKVLRFSRLFGPGKISSLPQIWRSVRRRRRKKQQKLKLKDGSDSTSDSDEPRRRHGYDCVYAPIPPRDQWASDDEDKLLSLTREEEKEEKPDADQGGDSKPKVADWRFGPAQVWYDMLDVPETGEDFNYGFKTTDRREEIDIKGDPIPDDAFLMVSQLHWEDDVVWDGNDIKHKVLQKLNSKINAAGWLPSSGSRTAGAFSQPGKSIPASPAVSGSKHCNSNQGKMSKAQMIIAAAQNKQQEETDDTWYSIFPVENEELVYSKWEEEVIWDAEAVGKIPKPKVLTLDPNDENIILGIPDDIDPSKIIRNTGPTPKVKIPHPHVKKSKILLGKAGVINVLAEDTPPPPPKSPDRDPYNISNDVFYMAKSSEATLKLKVGGGNLLQHSTPVVELRAPFIPTHMGPMKLRMFHRPPMKKYSHGALASGNAQPVLPLLKNIKKKAKQRELERIASGGGDVFFMRTPDDLSGRDGELVLVEFCEEHPPLMNQVGMATKIKNYYKRKAAKDAGPPEYRYGELHFAHTSPFLGILHPGHCMQVVENNMYRAPIYPQSMLETDFLVIRTRSNYYIREVDAIFTAGQECPLYEVPGPNSKRANNFVRDFLQVFIYRLFWKSKDNPRKIRMDDIKKAFPAHSESSIRKRLKQCADFKRTGMDSNFWVIKPEFRLPSEEEIRAMVSPEQCCAYFSMIAAEQRLKDAGYGEKFIFAQQEDDDEEMQLKMDDEVKVAPWNTTRAYIQAMRGKCILQLNGPADPTGCGEGFSYVRMPNKPTQQNKEEIESQPKRTVTGTDADLRRLSLNNAKALLRKFQVPEEEIKKLSRWEVIDVVRTLSTEKAKAGEEGMDKFSRGNRFSIAEHQERYKEECQRIFDLQNRVLASSEILSTDEGESTASEESDLEELGKNLENMLANKKTSTQLSLEREEQERQELLRKIMEEQGSSSRGKKKDDDLKDLQQTPTTKILKITRTFKNSEGREYTRVEIVRRAPVIEAYTKIRTTKDEAFIRQFATLDEAQKEEMKREKRRIQEQLRRIKRNQQKIGMLNQQHQQHSVGTPISLGDRVTPGSSKSSTHTSTPKESHPKEHSPSSRKKVKLKPDLKLKCGACGQVGHMRTNKACPLYTGTVPTPSLNVAMTEEQEEEIEKELNADDEDLVNVDGTKVKLSGKLLKRHEDVKRRTLLLKVPKEAVSKKRRRVGGDSNCDYLKRHNKTANRRRTDPVVVLSSLLEQILNELRDMPDVAPFMFPVNAKQVVDYHKIIQRPIDLQTIRENIRQKKYQTRDEFIADINQIVENSSLYNGPKSSLTIAAQRMLQKCKDRMQEKEERLTRLEKSINPLLDDDDQVALSYMLGEYVNGPLKAMPESWPFLKPVNKRLVKDYYTIIRKPMDLEKISKKVATHKYHSRADFLQDIQLIADNCETYNGAEANFTKQSRHMVEVVKQALEAMDNMAQLEKNIALVQERARNEDIDWEDDERDGKYFHGSRDTSPDRDFGDEDVSNLDRPSSAGSMTSSRPGPSGLMKPSLDGKKARGRPRKMHHEEVHKTHREELDGSLWLLSKILTLLPELIARRWQVHSLGRILAKLLHYGNSVKLRREGVRYFLLWYQALGDNAPPFVDGMFTELVPGLTVPQKGKAGPILSDSEYVATNDILSHPNMKGELGGSVFHDTGAHPVKSPEIQPLIPPSSSERTAAPDPRDGLEILLDCMVQSSGCLKWRDNNPQKHVRTLNFLLTKFREQYLPVFCPNFDYSTSIYEPKLDLPAMRNISKREEVMSSCIVVLVIWIAKYTHERHVSSKLDNLQIDEEVVGENASLLSNLRHMGYTQTQLVRDVLYSSRETINFVHEIYRQAFLMSFTSKSQIEAMRIAISVYRDWMSTIPPPPFLLEPDTSESSLSGSALDVQQPGARPTSQRLRTDSYLGAISKENVMIRAGLQNVLQVFVTNAVNVFMVNTAHLNIHFQSKTNSDGFATPLDEQTDICKRVLNIYRTMVMKTRMEAKTWEQLLLVLLQVTSVILQNSPPNAKKNNLGGRLAQPIFQTLIVTWIRAHTNVVVNPGLWDKFLKVLSSLTHREELIVEWDKTMQTLTRVLARQVYNINLSDLPLDRLAEQKGKRKRGTPSNWTQNSTTSQGDKPDNIIAQCINNGKSSAEEAAGEDARLLGSGHAIRSIPGTPSLNRSYSEGSLAPFRKSRTRRRIRNKHQVQSSHQHVSALPMTVEHSLNRMISNASGGGLSISNENLELSRFSQCDESLVMGVPTLRRALSLDSIRPSPGKNRGNDSDSYRCGSRSPSPTASSGIESGSIKDSPMQIDVLTADSSSIDTQDENSSVSADRRSILAGGTARGWLPDVAAVMWRRMLGALGDVNKILNPKLHAQVFQYLVNMTESLIKIRMNQGISLDGQPIPMPLNLVPPIALVAPWCYGALTLDGQYSQGKLYAMQLLCTIVKSGASLGNNQLPLFYHALHQALSGEDRAMAYTALRYLDGPRFLSLLLPGHSLLLLDLVHASTIVLTSSETGPHAPRAQVAGLLGSLLCFPKTSLPGPVLQPSEPNIDLMECPDLQEHVLNIVLRCARRESTAKARSIAISSLGQWVLQNLTNPPTSQPQAATAEPTFKQRIPLHHSSAVSNGGREELPINPRIREAFQVILQALQFKHRTIARLASETLKLCAEQGHRIERIDRLPQLIIDTICLSLEIQNVPHPKESDKTVLTSLLLTLGEFCMSFSVETLQRPKTSESDEPLIQVVFKVLHKIAMGIHNGERIKLFTTDEDFDQTITVDDVREQSSPIESTYQTSESIANCQAAIRLCAKTVAMHLITNLGHFPMGIGATRLSSLVDEQDDLTGGSTTTLHRENSVMSNRDSLELGASQVLVSPNLLLLMLSPELVASFIELSALKLPGGGATAGLITANRQVRLLLRDLNGKACWDASILYKEPSPTGEDTSRQLKDNSPTAEKQNSTFQFRSGSGGSSRIFAGAAASIDPMMSTVGLPMAPLRHTLRHRPVHQLPVAKDLAPDLDQLDDLLQYIGYTSPECLDANGSPLNTAGPSPLGPPLEAQTISIILNQRAIETEYIARQNAAVGLLGESPAYSFGGSVGYTSFIDDNVLPAAVGSSGTLATNRFNTSQSGSDRTGTSTGDTKPFQFGRILCSQLGLAGWERRKRTHLLQRTDKLLRELRNLDNQKCRETHKMAVIYVANGQEDKNSILRNSCGSSTYEMFVSALGWEVELESHNGFLGGLPRQGCGQTAPYYATPFLEVIFHVSTRMPTDTPEAILNKTRHLGNDEVHIVWSEHNRDYRRDILPTEFCDVLIVIYPLKSGLFRVTVNKKPEVSWFGPLSDEVVVGGSCLASLVRASAINASRAKRTSLSLYQQYYEERNRSLETVASRHKENNTFEDFTARIFSPIPPQGTVTGGIVIGGGSTAGSAPLAAALIDHHSRTMSKTWIHHPEMVATAREVTQQTVMASSGSSLDQPSPRPLRKLHHTFKPNSAKQPKMTPVTTGPTGGAGGLPTTLGLHHYPSTPPESPTLPVRTKFK